MFGKKSIAVFELLLLVGMSFSFAYLIGGTNDYYQGIQTESDFIKKTRVVLLNWLSKGLVSAQEVDLWTCPINNNGTICQEYVSDVCVENCEVDCHQGPISSYDDCELGICYDDLMGGCQENTPKSACEAVGGWWEPNDAPSGICSFGCCLSFPPENLQAQYFTSQQCNYFSETTGIPIYWDSMVSNEAECLLMAYTTQNEGACLLGEVNGEYNSDGVLKRNCKFTTSSECYSLGGGEEDFSEGTLCTNSGLNSICTSQQSDGTYETSCKEGRDEVYFLDTCGNFANVYDSTKLNDQDYWNRSYNYGEICDLSQGTNSFGNQNSCGNCAYRLGSICSEDEEEIADYGDYICADLNCEADEWGNERKHGESWCVFDGQIGVVNDGVTNLEKSVAVAGSNHYLKSCIYGEIRTDICGAYRNQVCVESRDEINGFSSAFCRINTWQTCAGYNLNDEFASYTERHEKLNECETNPDCTLLKADIASHFKFEICVPKNPPGFDLDLEYGGEIGESVCGLATQSCTYTEKEEIHWGGIFSGDFTTWECVGNCACKEDDFAKNMNNLCLSMGDCGGYVNIEGEYTGEGYEISVTPARFGAPEISSNYINSLTQYADNVDGQFVESFTIDEIIAIFDLSEDYFPEGDSSSLDFLGLFGLGAVGVATAYSVFVSGIPLAALTAQTSAAFTAALQGTGMVGFSSTAFGHVALGAAAGFAIAYMFSFAFDLGPEGSDALMIVGGITGAVAGVLIFGSGSYATFGAALGAFLFWTIVIIAVVAIILDLLLCSGDDCFRETEIKFTCLPWQPPSGGEDCEKCDDDSVRPCSTYKCQSLGQTCKFINEGSEDAICYDSSPNDVSAPIINVWEEVISENFEYVTPQENVGVEIQSSESEDGCIREVTQVNFGIETNEPAQCKISYGHTADYEDMGEYFSGSGLYNYSHQRTQVIPLFSELEDSGGNFDLFVRCKDENGNSNLQEYVINFCVFPVDDVTSPIITQFIPESPSFASLLITEKTLQFYTNEPADCRWSLEDIDYFSMDENIVCNNALNQGLPLGWLCNTILEIPQDESEEINYYFRCRDKPWVNDDDDPNNDDDRNVNTGSTDYMIIRSIDELFIEIISPADGDTLIVGSAPFGVDVEIHTSGGLDGNAICYRSVGGGESRFFQTGGTEHIHTIPNVFGGNHNYEFRCIDEAGNEAFASTSFTTYVDDQGPMITRIYDEFGTLKVITDENSECAYDHNSCAFSFEEGNLMSGSNLIHTTSFEEGEFYRIRCWDSWQNPGNCMIVTGGY